MAGRARREPLVSQSPRATWGYGIRKKHTLADAMLCFKRLSMLAMPISELSTSCTWTIVSSASAAEGSANPMFAAVVGVPSFSAAVAMSPRDIATAEFPSDGDAD